MPTMTPAHAMARLLKLKALLGRYGDLRPDILAALPELAGHLVEVSACLHDATSALERCHKRYCAYRNIDHDPRPAPPDTYGDSARTVIRRRYPKERDNATEQPPF